MKVLFICKGNRGRSQIAEAIFNNLYSNSNSSSAGTEEHHEGENLPEDVIAVLKEVGIDASSKKVKKTTRSMVESADKIIALCSKERCKDIANILKGKEIEYWTVPDPEGKGLSSLRITRDFLNAKIKELL